MKWYFWILIVVAVILTIIAIVAAVNSGKRRAQSAEAEVIKSNVDNLATSKSMIYKSLDRIALTDPLNSSLNTSNPECTTCKK